MTDTAPRPSSRLYSDRMNLIVDALCRAIAARAAKHWAAAPIMLVLWSYLRRVAARFERLLARIDAGRAVPRPPGSRPICPAGAPKPRLPTAFAWLRCFAPETASLGSQLKALLAEPELASRLAAAPTAGRLLRPLLCMLGEADADLATALPRRVVPRPPPQAPNLAGSAVAPPGFRPKPA